MSSVFQVESGDFFVRNLPNNMCAIAGVVHLPASTEPEKLHVGMVDQALRLNVDFAAPVQMHYPEFLGQSSINDLLRTIQWRGALMPGAMQFFVRDTPLPSDDAQMQWKIIAGGTNQQFMADGLYRIESGLIRQIDNDLRVGQTMSQPLKDEAVWGSSRSGGPYALDTDMTREGLDLVIAERNANPHRYDKEFFEFVRIMNERCPSKPYYTAEDLAHRDKISSEVIREVVDHDEDPALSKRSPKP